MTTDAPFHLLAKPTGAVCNLGCSYCFFLSKEMLYPESNFRMSDEVLSHYVRQLVQAQPGPEVQVAWQGGEPTLMGLDFYRRSVELVNRHLSLGQRAIYTFQTNGVLIDEEWATFLAEYGFLVGISIDGARELHDVYRVNKAGAGSFDQVIRGYRLLQEHAVNTNILCTVHAGNQDYPLEVYRFFRDDLGARFLQFIPIVERAQGETATPQLPAYQQTRTAVTSRSVQARTYGEFLVSIFEEWVRHDVGTVFVQMFDVTLGTRFGTYSLCVHAPTCGNALVLEHNGDLYSCDHYVEPDYLLGNIKNKSMSRLVDSPKQKAFGRNKLESLPRQCRTCDVRLSCHGGCPKDRFIQTEDGDDGLNYLCAGYQRFFRHIDAPMTWMAEALQAGQAPSGIMQQFRNQDAMRGRNSPCSCGSGRKLKRCHG